jgi:hypothetical protein
VGQYLLDEGGYALQINVIQMDFTVEQLEKISK